MIDSQLRAAKAPSWHTLPYSPKNSDFWRFTVPKLQTEINAPIDAPIYEFWHTCGHARGKLVFHVFGAPAEFERDLIRERTNAGLAAAARGRKGERKALLDAKKQEIARALNANPGVSVGEICKTLGVSRTTFYRTSKEKI